MSEPARLPVLRCGSHNPNGLTTAAAVDCAAAIWRRAGYQVVFLQEHHLTLHTRTASLRRLLQRHGWRSFVALSPPGASGRGRGGTAVLIRRDLLDSGALVVVGGGAAVRLGPEGRYTSVPVRWCGHHLHLCSVYLPSGDPAAQRQYISTHLRPLAAAACAAGCMLLWAGDFNFVPSPPCDRLGAGRSAASHPDVATQRRWGEALPELVDVWRLRHPTRRAFTYVVRGRASRLDRFYVSQALVSRVGACSVGRLTGGDHRPVALSLVGLQPSSQGSPRPRVRLGFCASPPLVQDFQGWLDREAVASPADDLGLLLWWPAFKRRLAVRCAALARTARRQAQGAQAAADELAALHAQLDAGDESVLPAILAARQRFVAARAEAEAGEALHRRHAWVHSGERPGPALTRRLRPRQQDRLVPALRSAGGGLLHRGTACAQRVAQYWAGVSARVPTSLAAQQEVLRALATGRCLSGGQAAGLGARAVAAEEVARALRTAPPGRSPGLDGIPAELYRRFKATFIPLLARLFTAIATLGQLPTGFSEGLITILYKSGDRADPANYRPITLLCTDYRLFAKVLALRLNPCLGDIIDREQTAFVPGRRIGENVLALQCLPELLRRQRRWAVVVFCDFRKAYDTIDRGFLFRAMDELGVGEGFLALVRLLLAGTRARAAVNGWVSTPELSAAGVRQGCPLAPLLYLFIAQALLRLLKARGVGIEAAGRWVTAFQFADDAEVLLPSLDHVPAFLSAMATFGDATNQRLNHAKTKLLPIGDVPAGLPATVGSLDVVSSASSLGVTFGAADPATGWQRLMEGVEAAYARIASLRSLSAFGRGFASAAYGVSRLLYCAEFAGHPPPAVLAGLERAASRLVGRGLAPAAKGRAFAGVAAALWAGRPAEGGFGAMHWEQHISARHAWWGLQLVLAPCSVPWVALARALLAACAPDLGGNPLGLLLWPAGQPLPGCVALLPEPLRRLHAGLAGLPRVLAVVPPALGPWCWAAPLWGNPLFCSADYPDGIDHPFFDFAAAGVTTVGQLLHLQQALAAAPGPSAYQLLWATLLQRSYAFADRHCAAERVTALLAALPPAWVEAAAAASAALASGQLQPPRLGDAESAMLPCLGWQRPDWAGPLRLRAYTVRHGTAMLAAPVHCRRLQCHFAPYAAEAAGAAHDGSAAEVLALLGRLWRVRCDNRVKEPFWRLVHDAIPTAARLHRDDGCHCGAGPPADRLHHFWGCAVARGVIDDISAALGATVGRAALWLGRAPPTVCGGVWDLVCLAAVAAMDHGRQLMYALGSGPPPASPLHSIAARSARAKFWSFLSDFVALRCAPARWREQCPPGHPFLHLDPSSGSLTLHCPTLAGVPAPAAG